MPLIKGCSKKVRDTNIKELITSGKPPEQASAIAYEYQRKQNCSVERKPKHKKRNVSKKKG